MLPSHQFYSGSNFNDSASSSSSTKSCNAAELDLPPMEPQNSYPSNISTNSDYAEILQLIQHPNYEDDLDLSDDDDHLLSNRHDASQNPNAHTKDIDAHRVEHPILLDTPSDVPISSKLIGQGRSQPFPEDEAHVDNRNKRQKLHQSQLSQNRPLENGFYPISSKKWSPKPMETPPPSTSEKTDSGKIADRVTQYYVQQIPDFRPKGLHKQPPQTTKNQTQSEDKENAPISISPPVVHFRQQINGIDSNNHGSDKQIVTKQPSQQKLTNHSNHASHHKQRPSIHCDENDNDNHGHVSSNRKGNPLPLSSVNINQANWEQSNIEKHHDKQQHRHNHQQKNDDSHRLSDRNPNQETSSTNDKKELTGVIKVKGQPFTILGKIGSGGSSSVYRVLHQKKQQVMALKYVPTEELKDSTLKDYRNEVNVLLHLQKLCSQHIPRLHTYEFSRSNPEFFIVLELGEMDLAHVMKDQKLKPLNMNFVRWYGQQMIEIVAKIHDANIIHRDLKPQNFILKGGSLKLIDFGISRRVKPPDETVNIETPIGTTNYMAPETITWIVNKLRQYTQIGRPSDIWSLGCILYQMIYGRPPFHEIPPDKVREAICDLSHKIYYPSVVHSKSSTSKEGEDNEDTVEIKVGNDAVHLLQACLDRNPLLRPTAKELLNHRFFHPPSSTL